MTAMKYLLVGLFLIGAAGSAFAQTAPADQEGDRVASITRSEAPVTWVLADGNSLVNVRVTRVLGNWVEVHHTGPGPLAAPKAEKGADAGKPPEGTAKPGEMRCWVNASQVARIIPMARGKETEKK